MLEIDGAQGEGGGQILRSAAALSAITGTPFSIRNIRANRKKPGLKRQHVTALRAAAEICEAAVDGGTAGSGEVRFSPGRIRGGDYCFELGTAGSTTLVAQTVLPMLLHASEPSTLALEGGTHNPFAPPFDFLAGSYLPQLVRMGAGITAQLVSHGFYPAGGGRVEFEIHPCNNLARLELLERGKPGKRRVRALVSNLPRHIAERECETIRRQMQWPPDCFQIDEVASAGPGNVVMIELQFEQVTEVFVAFGAKGRKAEHVASDVSRHATLYLQRTEPVGEFLADQLLLPMALGCAQGTGGGVFRTRPLSKHSTTHVNIIREFLGVRVDIREEPDAGVVVEVG